MPQHKSDNELDDVVHMAPEQASQLQNTRVLVVDDEPFVAMLITDVLEDLGCTTADAANGAAALDELRSNRQVDLMITDVGLPGGMNGRELATAARALRPELRILFVTGYAHGGGLDDGLPGDDMQIITKPFAIETLEHQIRTMLLG